MVIIKRNKNCCGKISCFRILPTQSHNVYFFFFCDAENNQLHPCNRTGLGLRTMWNFEVLGTIDNRHTNL